jgi:hypothetical protein
MPETNPNPPVKGGAVPYLTVDGAACCVQHHAAGG